MDLLIGTFVLRPYVFGFVAAFVLAAGRDLGWYRMLGFAVWVAPLAWVSEFTSTRIGIPFGLYQYTETTREQELFVANVPMMDSLSFTFLAYAAFCLARATLAGRQAPPAVIALVSGLLMMMLDVVIDPVAVQGDKWFLGPIFAYAVPGAYFGVPLNNFAGWIVLGTAGVGGYLFWSARLGDGPRHGSPSALGRGSDIRGDLVHTGWGAGGVDRYGRRLWPGIALYYAVLAFNLVVTGWIEEWLLLLIGASVHMLTAAALWNLGLRPATRLGLEKQGA